MRMLPLVLALLCVAVAFGEQQPPAQPASRPAAVGQTPSADRAPAQPAATFPSVYAASGPAELTADPDSPFWKDIKGVWIERRIDTSEPAPQLRTDVRSRWTASHLYFLFVCPYEQLNLRPDPQTVSDTNRLWEHDVLEVYIGSNFDDITKYLELQVSPQGEHLDGTMDATVPRVGIGNEWVWESGWKTRARLDRAKKVGMPKFSCRLRRLTSAQSRLATNSASISIACQVPTLRPPHVATSSPTAADGRIPCPPAFEVRAAEAHRIAA